jgi:hypothetical protein
MSPMSFESAYNEASKLFGNFIKIIQIIDALFNLKIINL